MNNEHIVSLIRCQFENLREVTINLIRAEKLYRHSQVGVFYFDFSQDLVKSDFILKEYLQQNIAVDFYKHEGSLQWNYYIYFVLDEANFGEAFRLGKVAQIETDRTFARKFVRENRLIEKELENPLSLKVYALTPPEDVASTWTRALREASLEKISDPNAPYTEIINQFLSGDTIRNQNFIQPVKKFDPVQPGSFLEHLQIRDFRPYPKGNDFDFGSINLIRGPNGSGKTSLLEAIELAICGGIARQKGDRPISAHLTIKFEGEEKYRRCPVRNSAIYRKRDLAWYGGYYRKGNQLYRNFGRFNFFDSDAAYKLSHAKTSDEITRAIHSLFLGETANTLEERMQACLDRFSSEDRDIARNIEEAQENIAEFRKSLRALAAIRDTREILFKELSAIAASIRWAKIPERLSLKEHLALHRNVSDLRSRLQYYRKQLHWMPKVSKALLIEETDRLLVDLEEIRSNQISAEKNAIALYQNKKKILFLGSKLKILKRILEYHEEESAFALRGVQAALQSSKSRLSQLAEALKLAKNAKTEPFEQSDSTFDSSTKELNLLRAKQLESVSQKRKMIAELEALAGEAKALVAQIKAQGRRFCEVKPHNKECPLCGARYKEGELLNRIMLLTYDSVEDPALTELNSNLSKEVARLTSLQRQVDSLSLLGQAASLILQNKKLSTLPLKSIIKTLASISDQISKQKLRIIQLTKQQRKLKLRGFTEAELEQLLAEAKERYSVPVVMLLNAKLFRSVVSEDQQSLEKYKKEMNDQEKKHSAIHGQLNQCIKKALGDSKFADPIVELQHRKELISGTLSMIRSYEKNLSFQEKEDFSTIESHLKSFEDAITRNQIALKKIEEKDVSEKRDSSLLAKEQTNLRRLQKTQSKARQAIDVLTRLLGSEGKYKYLDSAVKRLRENLVAIFSTIHAPKEFLDVSFKDEIVLHRHTGKKASVSEISGGQRTALALSIFLSLNSSVSDKAPWLIFDDPVVNIDDLNTLSFIDTLRDLVLLGKRQVFFATANMRIANLFARKFDFLGNEFKQFALSRTD